MTQDVWDKVGATEGTTRNSCGPWKTETRNVTDKGRRPYKKRVYKDIHWGSGEGSVEEFLRIRVEG